MQLDLKPRTAAALAVALAVLAVCLAWRDGAWEPFVPVPGGSFRAGSPEGGAASPPREATIPPFRMGRTEVTCAEFAVYLNATTSRPAAGEAQFRREGTRWHAVEARQPVAWVSQGDAEAYCRWLGQQLGEAVRLPTADEWEGAARGGLRGARFPWGWGPPDGRARFDADGPARVGSYRPNPFGLHDAAGNVAEWCADGDAPGRAYALGGSWADRNPDFLRVFHRVSFPTDYRDGDVGFRVVVGRQAAPGP